MKRRNPQRQKPRNRTPAPPVVKPGAAVPASAKNTPRIPAAAPASSGGKPDFAAILRGRGFRLAAGLVVFGFFLLFLSQAFTHDYGFFELGALFALSVYDLVLAMLGLSVAFAMAARPIDRWAIVLAFAAVLFTMLLFFDAALNVIMTSPLGDNLFLIAPSAVILTGGTLWLPERFRRVGVPLAAALVGFSFALFIGLDDLGSFGSFETSAVLAGLWIILSPGLLLLQFRGPWLAIPSRIVGSWLVVIGIIVMASLYVPVKDKAPPPVAPSDGTILKMPDGTTIPLDQNLGPEPQDPNNPDGIEE